MQRRYAPRKPPYHWLLPLAFFCIGLIYLYASPHFESPDGIYHVGVIKCIAETSALPIQSPDHEELYAHEGSQPPLYYLLMSIVWSVADTADFDDFLQLNPLVFKGHPERLGNRNLVFYRQPYPPHLEGTSLALYVIRLLTLVMGALTIFAIYRAARALEPRSIHLAILAAAFAAFNPQFLFISSSVSNDSLVAMLVALAERYQPGETFVTRHEFELAAGFAGEHSVYVGWYDEGIRQRLSAPYPANMLELPAIRFSAAGQ